MSNTVHIKKPKRNPVESNRSPFEFRLVDYLGRTDLIDPHEAVDRKFDETFRDERVAELTAADVDVHELHSVKSFARIGSATVRRIGRMGDTEAMFAVIEDTLPDDVVDDLLNLEAEELGRFYGEWQLAAGVNIPES